VAGWLNGKKTKTGMNEKKKLVQSLIFPVLFLLIIWLVKIAEIVLNTNFVYLGLYPLKWSGLVGIITAPLIHADLRHLFDNSVPLLILSTALFYFYRPVAFRVFFLTWVVTGILVWFGGRSSYHIGASGLIYGFASFLFFSGIIRNSINLMAISLLVVFMYGGLVWGILPYDYKISWESHMFGALTGLCLAIIYRQYGPPPPAEIPDENNDGEEDEN
jgi:membrane associated rhomboid family serine protease